MMGGSDPENRAPFPWDESQWDHDLQCHSNLCTYSPEKPGVETGEYEPILRGRQFAFVRRLENERVVVALNAGNESWDLNLPVNEKFNDGQFLWIC